MASRGEHVVQPAVADVESPAVAADDPHAARDQAVGDRQQLPRLRGFAPGQDGLELYDALALQANLLVGLLRALQKGDRQCIADFGAQCAHQRLRQVALRIQREAHAEAELRVVLEQAVGPCGALAGAVLRPRGGGQVAAVDGGATRGVGHQQVIAVELRQELDVGCFAAAGAGAGVFEQRRAQLRAFDQIDAVPRRTCLGQTEEEPVTALLNLQVFELGLHVDGFVLDCLLAARRTDVDANTAAGAVVRCHLQGVSPALVRAAFFRPPGHTLEALRRAFYLVSGVDVHADGSVRAHQRAQAALGADLLVPDRYFVRDAVFLPLRGRGGEGSVDRHCRHRKQIALAVEHHRGHALDEIRSRFRHHRPAMQLGVRTAGYLNFAQRRQRLIHRGEISAQHGFAALAVGLADRGLDLLYRFVARQDAGNRKEACLRYGVDAAGESGLLGHRKRVDYVHFEFLGDDLFLRFERQLVPDFVRSVGAVQQESGARAR